MGHGDGGALGKLGENIFIDVEVPFVEKPRSKRAIDECLERYGHVEVSKQAYKQGKKRAIINEEENK